MNEERDARPGWPLWLKVVLIGILLLFIAGSVPTAINIYKSQKYGVETSEARRAEEQQELWTKNIHCATDLHRQTKRFPDGTQITVGTCPNGDMLVETFRPGSARNTAQWIRAEGRSRVEETLEMEGGARSVFFGTNRLRNDKAFSKSIVQRIYDLFARPEPQLDRIRFGSETGRDLTLGIAKVSIPWAGHKRGRIERPSSVTVLDFKIYEGKEDPAKHFVISDVQIYDPAEFKQKMKAAIGHSRRYKDQAFVFVHGFNVSFDAAVYRTAQMAFDLEFDGIPFLYSWPSQEKVRLYETDQNISVVSEKYLKEFLDIVVRESGARKIHLIAHSMGNMPLLNVLKEFQLTGAERQDIKVDQIILAAPDIDREIFEDIAKAIRPLSNGMTLYASANDRAMQAARTYAGGRPRAGDVPEDGPAVVKGVDTIDASKLSMDFFSLNHTDFAERSPLLKDMAELMQTGVRPPSDRFKELRQVTTERGVYWKY